MLLKMIPTGLGMSTRTTFGDDQTETTHWLSFTLQVAGHDSLKLETGEVLENPAYASIRGNKPNEISANLTVHPASDKRGPSLNAMTYFEAMEGDDYSFPSSIIFEVFIPASDYSLLLNNIRGGIKPSSITVRLRHNFLDKASPITIGPAPDGSMMIWHNAIQQNRNVHIESIELYYQLNGADDHHNRS
jgi:hypothetical protein